MYFTLNEYASSNKMNSITGRLSVVGFGALGDGSTNDTAAIQATLAAAVTYGLTAYVPDSAGSYMVDAVTSIQMNAAGMSLELQAGATLQAIADSADNSAVVKVTAADCSIEGGTISGNVLTHIGSVGEHGHCILVWTGGDRCRISNLTVKNAWGDGIYIGGGVSDTWVTNCKGDTNRRNGLTIAGSNRATITGCTFINTGTVSGTAPKAGIDVEPNPSSGLDAIEFVISACICNSNAGAGIQLTRATAQTTRGKVISCSTIANTGYGLLSAGSAGSMVVDVENLTSAYNTGGGANLSAPGIHGVGGHFYLNTIYGIYANAPFNWEGGLSNLNGRSGLVPDAGATVSSVNGMTVRDNCTVAATTYHEVDVYAANFTFIGQVLPATSGNRAIYGVKVQTGATLAKIMGIVKTGTSGTVSPLGDTVQSVI